jgi:diguanylate cyclase (GGDEF)-like protein/PAS domain S-box-containing protein
MPLEANLYKEILDILDEGIYFVDRDRRVTFWNQAATRITGFEPESITGHACADRLYSMDRDGNVLCQTACPLQATMHDGRPREAQVYMTHADGHRIPVALRVSPLRDEQGHIIGAVEVFSDNGPVLKALRRVSELRREVEHDALTGIGNRRLMEREVAGSIYQCRQHGACSGLLFVDIDHFKRINDEHGHTVGDQVLRMVAYSLRDNIRTTDAVARWGGEEFVVLLRGLPDESALARLAEKLRMLVEHARLTVGEQTVRVTVSIGATRTRPDDTVENVIERADQLLYQSKAAGRNRVTMGA